MSAALSAAKKRRAPTSIQPETPRMGGSNGPNGDMQTQSTQGMTLPQVISLIDKRLIQLELFSKNFQTSMKNGTVAGSTAVPEVNKDEIVNAVLEEFQSRFDVMAEEIAEMKQIVMHLQSYTMDVNKMLLSQLQQSGMFTLSNSENNSSEEDSS